MRTNCRAGPWQRFPGRVCRRSGPAAVSTGNEAGRVMKRKPPGHQVADMAGDEVDVSRPCPAPEPVIDETSTVDEPTGDGVVLQTEPYGKAV